MAELTVDIVAPDRVLWSGKATMVSAPSIEGSLGILPGHEPLLAVLGAGQVKVKAAAGSDRLIDITSGFISLDHDTITIVAETPSE